MAIPGTLDHLYYGGVIDHIPYEAYAQPIMTNYSDYGTGLRTQNGYMLGTNYLDYAQQGLAYNTYQPDMFMSNSQKTYHFTPGIKSTQSHGKNIFTEMQAESKANPYAKGIAALGILAITLGAILSGGKKGAKKVAEEITETTTKKGFWTRLNPKNWFSKNKNI